LHAYVINLANSLDRRAHVTAELEKACLDYEVVTAIDGRELDLHDHATIAPSFLANVRCLAGAAGCALSHLDVYRKIIDDGLDMALVLEDDVILPADLGSLADAVGKHLVGAEVALLSFDSRNPPCKMSREGLTQLPSARQLVLPIDIWQPLSGAAFIITREACERMIERALPLRTVADEWCFFYREGILDRVRCVVPVSVYKKLELASTIGSYTLGDSPFGRLVAPLLRRQIPLLHQLRSYRLKRIYRNYWRTEFAETPFIEKPSRLA
jgi:glycosyl transferase, family 25